jgi:hypothetical protein
VVHDPQDIVREYRAADRASTEAFEIKKQGVQARAEDGVEKAMPRKIVHAVPAKGVTQDRNPEWGVSLDERGLQATAVGTLQLQWLGIKKRGLRPSEAFPEQ